MSNDKLRIDLEVSENPDHLDSLGINIWNFEDSKLIFNSDIRKLIENRAWSYISVGNWKVIIVLGNEIIQNTTDTRRSSVKVKFYDSKFNQIDWVVSFLAYHWISAEQIEEALRINIKNPFFVWEVVSEFTSKKVYGILVED